MAEASKSTAASHDHYENPEAMGGSRGGSKIGKELGAAVKKEVVGETLADSDNDEEPYYY